MSAERPESPHPRPRDAAAAGDLGGPVALKPTIEPRPESPAPRPPSAIRVDPWLLRQARPASGDLAVTVGLGLLGSVTIVGQAYLLSRTVSRVFLDGRTLEQVGPLLTGLLLLSLGRAGLTWGSEAAAGRAAVRVTGALRERLTAHVLALGPAYARGERSGELVNTAVQGVEALDAYFRQYLPQLALAALVPITVLLFVFPQDWVSALVLLLTAPLLPLFMVLIGRAAESLTRQRWTSLSRMSAHFLDVLQGLPTLKLLGRSQDQVRTVADVSDQFRQATLSVLRVAFLSALVLEMVSTLGTAVVAVQVGLRLLYGHLAFQDAFFVLILAPEFYVPLRLLGTRFHSGMQGVAAAERISEVLRANPGPSGAQAEARQCACADLPASDQAAGPQFRTFLNLAPGLCFEDVHCAYDTGQRPALNGLSFELSAGQRVALVGPSGAGKSTVAQLLLRFIEPDRGAILVGGVPLQELPAVRWRERITWVPPNPFLFHATVAENIRLARPSAGLDEVIWAARQAHAHTFIEALPQGYDTPVGERGARLSQGEAQRLALARAFLKDAPLLILDEATAHLDPETEDQVQDSLARLLPGRTALIIAHRLRTVYGADQILVLDQGRVVQAGNHAELVQRDGLYRHLVQAYVPPGTPTGREDWQPGKGERTQDAAARGAAGLGGL